MNKRPTIIDVAKQAGVSKSTVSLVLQNSDSVKDETKDRVMLAIQKTNYVYNRNAAKLRTKNTGLIGFIINDITNTYYAEISSSIQHAFAQRGYTMVLGSSGRSEKLQTQLINSMIEHGVSALVIAPVHSSKVIDFEGLIKSNIPTLQIFRKMDFLDKELPFYSMDYEQGTYLATQHLCEIGLRKIAFVGGMKDRAITEEKISGYHKALLEKGMESQIFYGNINRKFGYELAIDIAKNKNIDGIVAFNDTVAIGMLAGFAKSSVKIGEDISLIGFDDIEEASYCHPTLSSVRCKVDNLGNQIAHDLLDWLERKKKIKSYHRYPVELIVRNSSKKVN